jgi:hypothetical protein
MFVVAAEVLVVVLFVVSAGTGTVLLLEEDMSLVVIAGAGAVDVVLVSADIAGALVAAMLLVSASELLLQAERARGRPRETKATKVYFWRRRFIRDSLSDEPGFIKP